MGLRFRESDQKGDNASPARIVQLRNPTSDQLKVKLERAPDDAARQNQVLEELVNKSNAYRIQLKEIQSKLASFLLRISQVSSAYKALTDALSGFFDPKWEQYSQLKASVQEMNIVLENLTDNLTHTLSKPIDLQQDAFSAVKPKVKAWKSNLRGNTYNVLLDDPRRQLYASEPKLTQFGSTPITHSTEKLADTLKSELLTINQNCQFACCETWMNLLDTFAKENNAISQLVQTQKHRLTKLQSRLNQNKLLDDDKISTGFPIPDRARTPNQFHNVLNGKSNGAPDATSLSTDFSMRPRLGRPTRPLRARELEAIKQLSSSSQDVTLNGYTDLFASDSSTDSNDFFRSTDALNQDRSTSKRRGNHRRSRGNDNWSEPSSISNAQGIRMQPFNRFEITKRLEQYLPRSNPLGGSKHNVIDQQFYTGSNRDQSNKVRMITAPSAKPREVTIREAVWEHSPKVKRPSRIIIQKQAPSNGFYAPWNRQTEGKAASTEFMPNKQMQSEHKSTRFTIIDHSPTSSERTRRTLNRSDSPTGIQQSTQHSLHQGGADATKVKTFEVITTYPYTAQDTDELTLRLNDVVRVLPWPEGLEDELGWLYGERVSDGVRGIFPANFTTLK